MNEFVKYTYTNAVQECIQELLSEQNGNITTLL